MLKYLAVFALISGPVFAQDAKINAGPVNPSVRYTAECFTKFAGKTAEMDRCLAQFKRADQAPRGYYLQGRQ